MGKYAKYQPVSPPRPRHSLHPVWRGIGCLLIVIIPVMSYALATLLAPEFKASGKFPPILFMPVRFPAWVGHWPALNAIARFISSIENLGAIILLFSLIMPLLTGLFTLLYILVYQYVGPPRYTIFDTPPPKYKAKKYKR